MTNKKEGTFGLRLTNASTLATTVSGYANYKPPGDDATIETLNELLDKIRTANSDEAVKREARSLLVAKKDYLIFKSPASLAKLIPLIKKSVNAQYGKASKELQDISAYIKKLSSHRSSIVVKKENETNAGTSERKISRSHLAFGSQVENFKGLIDTLNSFTPKFTPPNDNITIDQLNAFYGELISTYELLKIGDTAWHTSVYNRRLLYENLDNTTDKIKISVSCQYTPDSIEYFNIKNL